jgi:hypothetical protein
MRHLQQPYCIWPLSDYGEVNPITKKLSTFNLPSSLSMAKCNNPQSAVIHINEGSRKLTTPREVEPTRTEEATIDTAVAQVLHTAELLELILSNVSPTTLYHSRNTCTLWRTLIDTSPTLSKCLWFQPSGPAIFPSRDYQQTQGSPPFKLNPIMQDLGIFNARHTEWDECHRQHWFANITFPPRYITKNALWREMQVTQPPIRSVFLRSSWLEKYVECEAGITVGMLSDLLEFQVGRLYFFHC